MVPPGDTIHSAIRAYVSVREWVRLGLHLRARKEPGPYTRAVDRAIEYDPDRVPELLERKGTCSYTVGRLLHVRHRLHERWSELG